MSAYRFCRTDDIQLLVEALNRCWLPHFPGEPPITATAFKRSIRDLQVWCSSCMVAFSENEPVGVLIGAKRPSGTLIHKIAVHPDHWRRGHGRHLLASLSSKLAILGPPRIRAEIPEHLDAARALFTAAGYLHEADLRDYTLEGPAASDQPQPDRKAATPDCGGRFEGLLIPVTVDDLTANGALDESGQSGWDRSAETLIARKDDIEGIAVASDEGIDAYLLYADLRVDDERAGTELLACRSFVDDGGARLQRLLGHLRARGSGNVRFSKVHPAEIPAAWLHRLGFRPAGAHLLFTATARAA